MGQAARGSGLVAAGLGWGVAIGVALGTLLIAPAMDGTLGTPGAGTRASQGAADGSGEGAAQTEAQTEAEALAQEQVAAANALLADEGDAIVAGRLDGVAVTMIRTADASEEDAAGVRWMANAAGATNSGSIRLTEKFFDQSAADELTTIITTTLPAGTQLPVDGATPATHAGVALAAALTTASAEDRALVLDSLQQAGFVETRGETVPADVIVIVTADALADQPATDFAEALAGGATAVAAAQGTAPSLKSAYPVSYVDTEAGRVGAVLAAQEAVQEANGEAAQ